MSNSSALNIPILADEEGMIGRECPDPDCGKYFKVRPGTGIQNNPAMFCPYCEHKDQPGEFLTTDQLDYAASIALRHFCDELDHELKKLKRYSFKGSLLSMDIKVKGGTPTPIRHYLERELQEHLCCENCRCEYAIYGAFAVCPDCGQQNLFQVLTSNLDLIRRQVSLEQSLHDTFGEQHSAELKELLGGGVGQKLVEDACENVVTVFETFFKELDRRHRARAKDPTKHLRGNLFQQLDGTRDWFLDQYGFDIFATLKDAEIENLYLLFNKRHILTHNLGIIDEKYLDRTGLRQDLLDRKVDISADEVLAAIDPVARIMTDARGEFV